MNLLCRFNARISQQWISSGNGALARQCLSQRWTSSSSLGRGARACRWLSAHDNTIPLSRASSSTLTTADLFCQLSPRCFSSSTSKYAFVRSPQDEQVIRDLFLSFATQQDGEDTPSLRVEDLRGLLLAIGDRPSDSKLSRLIEVVDADKNGRIEYDEFVAGCEEILDFSCMECTEEEMALNIDTLVDIFHTLDADGSGDLTLDEISGLLSTASVSLGQEDARDIMNAADANDDGKLCLEEFLRLMTDRSKNKYTWRIRSGFRACLVMGGPGSGKGTLCNKMVEYANIRHCSSGEMLREEIESGSPLAKSIQHTMKEGKLVPSSTIIALVKKQLRQYPGSLVALDGFPRNRQNCLDFDEILGKPEFVIFVDVSDGEMISRIMKRAETSGRADDNLETAQRRIKTFHDATKPTLAHLELSNVPIYHLDGAKSPDEVWEELMKKCPQIGSRL